MNFALPEKGAITIGRSSESSLVLAHNSVSRRHAILHVSTVLEVEDLGSANGVSVDGKKLASKSRAIVRPGTVLALGDVTLFVQGSSVENASAKTSTVMESLHATIALVAKSSISVLLRGETGVGKGVFANEIHRTSPRHARPMMPINCGALAESLLESELFGHEKGAFTGANKAAAGLIESADGGTVLLDEIGEMSLTTQVKLLRVIENREVMRVGGRKAIAVDVRFIAATHRDLEAMVALGSFREDLFFRLNGITITIPPLRDRKEEIIPIAEQFLKEQGSTARLTAAVVTALRSYEWPGNIRELRNVIERAALLAGEGDLRIEHLGLKPNNVATPIETHTKNVAPANDERARILEMLDRFAGNQTRAADALGMSRRTFLRKLEEYGLPRPRLRK